MECGYCPGCNHHPEMVAGNKKCSAYLEIVIKQVKHETDRVRDFLKPDHE